MSLWYKILYEIGITPWEADPIKGAAAEQISTLFDREENERQPPFGQVLDLGCGSGIWSMQLAARGWQVTGVDIVPKAIHRARRITQDDVYAGKSEMPSWLENVDPHFYRLRYGQPDRAPA